jgi:hypothetical protein
MAENGAENGDKGTDPQSALSKEEADAVIESWALLWKDKKQNGIDLFVKYSINSDFYLQSITHKPEIIF